MSEMKEVFKETVKFVGKMVTQLGETIGETMHKSPEELQAQLDEQLAELINKIMPEGHPSRDQLKRILGVGNEMATKKIREYYEKIIDTKNKHIDRLLDKLYSAGVPPEEIMETNIDVDTAGGEGKVQ